MKTRTNNPYGKQLEKLEEVLYYLETVEPLLRRGATCEIKTTLPLEQVVEEVLARAGPDITFKSLKQSIEKAKPKQKAVPTQRKRKTAS